MALRPFPHLLVTRQAAYPRPLKGLRRPLEEQKGWTIAAVSLLCWEAEYTKSKVISMTGLSHRLAMEASQVPG